MVVMIPILVVVAVVVVIVIVLLEVMMVVDRGSNSDSLLSWRNSW